MKTVEPNDAFATIWAKHPNWHVLHDIQPYRAFIQDLTTPEKDDGSLSIRFHRSTPWPKIVEAVAKMRADECWEVNQNKTVTLWWD